MNNAKQGFVLGDNIITSFQLPASSRISKGNLSLVEKELAQFSYHKSEFNSEVDIYHLFVTSDLNTNRPKEGSVYLGSVTSDEKEFFVHYLLYNRVQIHL